MGVRHYLQWIIEDAPDLSEAKKDEVRSDIQWLDDGQPNQPTVVPFFGPLEAEFCEERLEELVLHCVKFQRAGRVSVVSRGRCWFTNHEAGTYGSYVGRPARGEASS